MIEHLNKNKQETTEKNQGEIQQLQDQNEKLQRNFHSVIQESDRHYEKI